MIAMLMFCLVYIAARVVQMSELEIILKLHFTQWQKKQGGWTFVVATLFSYQNFIVNNVMDIDDKQ